MQSLPLGVRFLVGVPLRRRGNLDLLAWQYTACAVCIAFCATFTQFRYSVFQAKIIITQKNRFVNSFLKFLFGEGNFLDFARNFFLCGAEIA